MRKGLRVVSVILLFVAQNSSAARPLRAGQMGEADPFAIFSQLKTTLSKLYPIEHWAISPKAGAVIPFAPRFCWEFFRPDPATLGRLGDAIRDYQGSVNWVIGLPLKNATCLVAAERGAVPFVGYPPIGRPAEHQAPPTQEFVDRALADVPNLCTHLERYLRLEHLAPKSFDQSLIAPTDPPSGEVAPLDFVERGTHVAWIVYGDTGKEASSRSRLMLHFSVRTEEWGKIRADVLDRASITSEDFPNLAKIRESESVYFRGPEVDALRQECLRARASSTRLAIRGLDKLILLCDWAHRIGGDLSLRAP